TNLAGFGFGAIFPSWLRIDVAMPDFRGAHRKRCVSYFTLRPSSQKMMGFIVSKRLGSRYRSGRSQAVFRPPRHPPGRPPLAKIRPGSPAPAIGPGTPLTGLIAAE